MRLTQTLIVKVPSKTHEAVTRISTSRQLNFPPTDSVLPSDSIDPMNHEMHIAGNKYLTELTFYFVGYVLFETPSNVILKWTWPHLWLHTLTLFWAIAAGFSIGSME
jgi:hypothetical protein